MTALDRLFVKLRFIGLLIPAGLLLWLRPASTGVVIAIAGFLAAIARQRWRMLRNGVLVFVILLLPQLFVPGGGVATAGSFLSPDTYWSNVSINGWLSRLGIASSWTRPPLPGLPVEAVMLVLVALLTAATVVVLVRARERSLEGALASARRATLDRRLLARGRPQRQRP